MSRAALAILAAFLAAAARAAAPDLAALKAKAAAKFAAVRTLQADFTQTRVLRSMQGAKIVFTGRVALEKGGRLAWLVEKPVPYRCVISARELVQWDGETVTTLDADRLPWLRLLYSSLTEWVAADLAELQKKFDLSPLGERTLKLVPREEFLKARTREMELTFAPDYGAVERVVIAEPSGDTLTLDFTRLRLNEPLDPALWKLPPR